MSVSNFLNSRDVQVPDESCQPDKSRPRTPHLLSAFIGIQRGEVTGAINCFYDITERKGLEEALRQSHANLEHTVRQRTVALTQLSAKLMRA
jgi:signal transduction histidine kinase